MIKEIISSALREDSLIVSRKDFSVLQARPNILNDLDPKSETTEILSRELRFNSEQLPNIFEQYVQNIKQQGIYPKMDRSTVVAYSALLLTARTLTKPFQEEIIDGEEKILDVSNGKKFKVERFEGRDFDLAETIIGLLTRYTLDNLTENQREHLRSLSNSASYDSLALLESLNFNVIEIFRENPQFYKRKKLFFAKAGTYTVTQSKSIWSFVKELGLNMDTDPQRASKNAEKAEITVLNSQKNEFEQLARISREKDLPFFLGDIDYPTHLNWTSVYDVCFS